MRVKMVLAQNFLTSPEIAMDVVDAGDIHADDIVLEIGAGKGVLTEKILPLAGRVVAIEKDRELVEFLKEKFPEQISSGQLEILEEDVRDFDPSVMSFYDLEYKVVANIPYYITGLIIKKFLTSERQPSLCVLMVQREVAERIVARDGKESLLSISVKAYGTPRVIKKVKAGSFFPKPKVDSAIILIEGISKNFFKKISEEKFFEIVRAGFHSKRKQLINNLMGFANRKTLEKIFSDCGISPTIRAEEMSLADWKKIRMALDDRE